MIKLHFPRIVSKIADSIRRKKDKLSRTFLRPNVDESARVPDFLVHLLLLRPRARGHDGALLRGVLVLHELIHSSDTERWAADAEAARRSGGSSEDPRRSWEEAMREANGPAGGGGGGAGEDEWVWIGGWVQHSRERKRGKMGDETEREKARGRRERIGFIESGRNGGEWQLRILSVEGYWWTVDRTSSATFSWKAKEGGRVAALFGGSDWMKNGDLCGGYLVWDLRRVSTIHPAHMSPIEVYLSQWLKQTYVILFTTMELYISIIIITTYIHLVLKPDWSDNLNVIYIYVVKIIMIIYVGFYSYL